MTRNVQRVPKDVLGIITRMIDFIKFIRMCCRAYSKATDNGTWYIAALLHGVPYCTVFVGRGREAWRVSNLAIVVKED